MKKSIVFAGFSLPTYVEIARTLCEEQGFELICIYNRQATGKYQAYLNLFDQSIEATDTQALAEIDPIAITCTQERDAQLYLTLLKQFSIIDTAEYDSFQSVINKESLKQKLAENGHTFIPRTYTLENIPREQNAYPLVIKPIGFGGSVFVKKVSSYTEAIAFHQANREAAVALGQAEYGFIPSFVAEDFIEGPQFGINVYISKQGETIFCPFVRVVPALEIDLPDTYSVYQYTPWELPADQTNDLENTIKTVIKEFSLHSTSAHFDLVQSPNGWKLLEVGLRIGGNRHTMFNLSHKLNHFRNDLLNRLRQPVEMTDLHQYVAIVQKTTTRPGAIRKIEFPQNLDEVSIEKQLPLGTLVGPRAEGYDIAVRANITAQSQTELETKAERFFSETSIELDE